MKIISIIKRRFVVIGIIAAFLFPVIFMGGTMQLNIVFAQSTARTPSCPNSSQFLSVKTDGSYTCTTKAQSAGKFQVPAHTTYYNADGTQGQTLPTSCVVSYTDWSPIFNPTCWGRTISVVIGTLFISLTSWLLEVAGNIFNWLVDNTIIQFGTFGSSQPLTDFINSINIGWSLFRDLSNLVIIGLFTFIAIATILGLKEYGYKKLVARVLIIAVLINFSLLFTKLIIDGSNFTAYQFYTAASGSFNDPTTQAANTTTSPASTSDIGTIDNTVNQFAKSGIAGQFIRYMGVTSVTNTASTLFSATESLQNGWVVLLHGIFAATMLLGAALVLLYGSFLLVTRAIMIILLMLTASIAFATHLVPAFDKKGWGLWWESLIKAAVFAPILMIFLWITILLSRGLQPAGGSGGGSLGSLLSDPTNKGSLGALFGYIMVLGLLYASFKISSSFATMAGSINFGSLATTGLAVATGGVAGFALRNSVGRGANALNERMTAGAARLTRSDSALARGIGRTLYSGTQPLKAVAGSKSFGDFKGNTDRRGAAYGKMATDLKLSDKTRDKIRGEADQKVMKVQENHTAAVANKEKAEAEHTDAVKSKESGQKAISDLKATHEEALRAASSDPTNTNNQMAAEAARYRLQKQIEGQKEILRDQDARIANARTTLDEAKSTQAVAAANLQKITERSAAVKKNVDQSEADLAKQLAHGRFSNTLKSFVGLKPEIDNDSVVTATSKYVESHHKKEATERILTALGSDDVHTSQPAIAAPTEANRPMNTTINPQNNDAVKVDQHYTGA